MTSWAQDSPLSLCNRLGASTTRRLISPGSAVAQPVVRGADHQARDTENMERFFSENMERFSSHLVHCDATGVNRTIRCMARSATTRTRPSLSIVPEGSRPMTTSPSPFRARISGRGSPQRLVVLVLWHRSRTSPCLRIRSRIYCFVNPWLLCLQGTAATMVLVGMAVCSNVEHDSTFPDSQLTCRLPAHSGTGDGAHAPVRKKR